MPRAIKTATLGGWSASSLRNRGAAFVLPDLNFNDLTNITNYSILFGLPKEKIVNIYIIVHIFYIRYIKVLEFDIREL